MMIVSKIFYLKQQNRISIELIFNVGFINQSINQSVSFYRCQSKINRVFVCFVCWFSLLNAAAVAAKIFGFDSGGLFIHSILSKGWLYRDTIDIIRTRGEGNSIGKFSIEHANINRNLDFFFFFLTKKKFSSTINIVIYVMTTMKMIEKSFFFDHPKRIYVIFSGWKNLFRCEKKSTTTTIKIILQVKKVMMNFIFVKLFFSEKFIHSITSFSQHHFLPKKKTLNSNSSPLFWNDNHFPQKKKYWWSLSEVMIMIIFTDCSRSIFSLTFCWMWKKTIRKWILTKFNDLFFPNPIFFRWVFS